MAINSVQDMMLDSLLKASRAAEQITPAVERCRAYTELAKACAAAIETKGSTEILNAEAPKEVPKTAKRASRKVVQPAEEKKVEEIKAEEAKVEEPVVEEKQPEAVDIKEPEVQEPDIQQKEKTPEQLEEEEYDFTTEWTPKACELLEKEINEVQRYYGMFANDLESFNAMVVAATEGASVDLDSITPLNIRVVLKYIKDLADAAKEEEGAENA